MNHILSITSLHANAFHFGSSRLGGSAVGRPVFISHESSEHVDACAKIIVIELPLRGMVTERGRDRVGFFVVFILDNL